jgi:peroxiredoxin
MSMALIACLQAFVPVARTDEANSVRQGEARKLDGVDRLSQEDRSPALAHSAAESAIAPAEADAAWAEILRAHEDLSPPREWERRKPSFDELNRFRTQLLASARKLAEKAGSFVVRFPTNPNVPNARSTIVFAFSHAVAAGDAMSEAEAWRFVDATIADKAIPLRERVQVQLTAAHVPLCKRLGMAFFNPAARDAEMDRALWVTLAEAKTRHPANPVVYMAMLAAAERAPASLRQRLLAEILESKSAPPNILAIAMHLQGGTKPFEIGEPLELAFTALDGTQVNLLDLAGKVVLLIFWSTDCAPCVPLLREIKALDRAHSAKDLSVIGISLDENRESLERVLRSEEISWPHHFESSGLVNRFAVQYGVVELPSVWLLDRGGLLRAAHLREGVAGRVETLIAGKR